MRRSITLSVYGLYEFDNSIFDNLALPSMLDRETVIDNILLECMDLETLYPSVPMLKAAIGIWSKKELPVWEHLAETLAYKYDPIYNYDRTEEYSEEWQDKGTQENVMSRETHGTASENNTNKTTGSIQNSREDNNLETRNLKETTGATEGRTGTVDFTRNLSESGNTSGSENSTRDNSGELTSNIKSTDGGKDVETQENPGFNVQQGMIDTRVKTTEYGKTNTTDHTQNTSENETIGTTSRSDSSLNQSGTTKETTKSDSQLDSSVDQTGTVSKTGNVSENQSSVVDGVGNKTSDNTETVGENENGSHANDGTKNHKMRAYGNIGVTTTQQLIEQERALAEFNLVNYITDSFKHRFCILVY